MAQRVGNQDGGEGLAVDVVGGDAIIEGLSGEGNPYFQSCSQLFEQLLDIVVGFELG